MRGSVHRKRGRNERDNRAQILLLAGNARAHIELTT